MGGSGSFIVSLVLLFAGTLVAITQIKGRSERIEASNIVPLPRIGGGALRHGPWPGCLGIEADACVELIESYASDCKGHVLVITPDMVESMAEDFDVRRVRVFVGDDGMVSKIPLRGR